MITAGKGSSAGSRVRSSTLASIKLVALSVLIFQNASLVLVMRYSHLSPKAGEPPYLATSAVLMGEIVKVAASSLFLLFESRFNVQDVKASIVGSLLFVRRPRELASLSVPAVLYVIQNNLVYVAAANLDPAPFQLLFQLKILTTALLSKWLLQKSLTYAHWQALVVLFVGVLIVQMSAAEQANSRESMLVQDPLVGLIAILVAVTCSGLSGVWFEKILKGSSMSLWLRNIQLASVSIVFAACSIWIKDSKQVLSYGLFSGYSPLVWFVILLQSGGGLIVAIVVKYADNILKGFATSIATVLSTLASVIWFDFHVSALFSVGAVLVLTSAYLYNIADMGTFKVRNAQTVDVGSGGRIEPGDAV
jgi:UDP-sugar transporter A1/2/3